MLCYNSINVIFVYYYFLLFLFIIIVYYFYIVPLLRDHIFVENQIQEHRMKNKILFLSPTPMFDYLT